MKRNNGYVYIRLHIYYIKDGICKLGKTKNIPDRDNNYATGEYIRGYFVLVIEISSDQIYDDTFVEKLLQNHFKNYHSRKNGGSEYYQSNIIDEIVPFLKKTKIKFNELTEEQINNLIHQERVKKSSEVLKRFFHNIKIESKENRLRNKLQNEYLNEIKDHLIKYRKAFLKAPTGFGKTHLYYKIIELMKFNKILFLTPRKELNKQMVEDKYSSYIKNDNFKIVHFSDLDSNKKENTFKDDFTILLKINSIVFLYIYIYMTSNIRLYNDSNQGGPARYPTGWGCNNSDKLRVMGLINTGNNNNATMSSYNISGSNYIQVYTDGECNNTVPGVCNVFKGVGNLPSEYNDRVRSFKAYSGNMECFQNESPDFNNNNISKNYASNRSKNNNIYLFILLILIIIAFYNITKK